MPIIKDLDDFLADATVADDVFTLRPDYRALLLAVDGIEPGASNVESEALLVRAEASAAAALAAQPVEELPHIAAWRDAYRAFGAKPQRTRNSLEALTRRVAGGLPRMNRLTDIYNAISVIHQLPLGGENLAAYTSAPHLIRANGTEIFDSTFDGEPVIEHPDAGEVVWSDSTGVTCRRWNWRQCRRTQLTDDTTTALFILDVLDPTTNEELTTAADELIEHLSHLGANVTIARRLITNH